MSAAVSVVVPGSDKAREEPLELVRLLRTFAPLLAAALVCAVAASLVAPYPVGIFLLVPLGDRVRARPLIVVLMVLTAAAMLAAGLATSLPMLLIAGTLAGAFTVVPQVSFAINTTLDTAPITAFNSLPSAQVNGAAQLYQVLAGRLSAYNGNARLARRKKGRPARAKYRDRCHGRPARQERRHHHRPDEPLVVGP